MGSALQPDGLTASGLTDSSVGLAGHCQPDKKCPKSQKEELHKNKKEKEVICTARRKVSHPQL